MSKGLANSACRLAAGCLRFVVGHGVLDGEVVLGGAIYVYEGCGK